MPATRWSPDRLSEAVQRLLEAIGVRALGLGQRLEPVGDLAEALFTRLLGHPRIHVRVLVGLAGDGGLEIQLGLADRKARSRITHRLEILEMPMGMAGLALGGGTKYRGDVVEAFDIGLGREIQITTIRLRFAGKCVLQILLSFGSTEFHDSYLRTG